MSISTFARAASGSLLRNLWNRDRAAARRRSRRVGFAPAVDQLESRVALSITQLSLGIPGVPDVTVGSFLDAPTGPGNVSDFVTVSIEGTKGTVIFNGGTGVADGTNIQTIEILDASPDFQVTFGATVGTANAVPYGSDGVIQMGRITTGNVIRGINTVRGPLTNTAPTTGVASPIGFTQTTAGSNTLFLEGNQTSTFPLNAYVCATPLLSNTTVGAPSFGTVTTSSFDANTNLTTIIFDNTTAAGTTAGALTLAERVQPYFALTSFVGVNFSNLNLKDGGGIFVDRVVGGDTEVNGDVIPDLGILLSQGLLAYSTIGIRDVLDATVVLGTTSGSSVDGRMFVESATGASLLFVGPQTTPTAKNSKFQLTGGTGAFGAAVLVAQPFDGVVNLGGPATGSWVFNRGVGANAVLNATSWVGQTGGAPRGVSVTGNFAGSINATDGEVLNAGDITLTTSGNLAATARVNAHDFVSLSVLGGVLKGATVAAGGDMEIAIAKNFAGSLTVGGDLSGTIGGNVTGASITASNDLSLDIGGSVVNSAILSYSDHTLDVAGSIRNSRFHTQSNDMSIDVKGSVTNSNFTIGYDYLLELIVGGNMSGSTATAGSGDVSVDVTGNVTNSQFTSTSGDVTVDAGGSFLRNKIVTGDGVNLTVGRNALDNTVLGDDNVDIEVTNGNWRGVAQSASSDLLLDVGGSVLKGSSFSSGQDTQINVAGNFDASTTSRSLRFLVGGNVSQASRIVAQQVTNWQGGGDNFRIGGRFDGIVNVGVFDAAPNNTTVTIIGNGAGKSARFYVDRFETDTLVFNGNFRGNMRVLQDLTANLNFGGNVDRITIGGRVGSYVPGNTITTSPAVITVAGRLLYLNTNSYFQATTPGAGIFWNDATTTVPDPFVMTGALFTGSYVTVVPNRQTVSPPSTPPAQLYSVPGTPGSFNASLTGDPDTPPNTPYGISVTFAAPTSSVSGPGDGNLPVLYYEYTTNANLGAGATWSRFSNAGQQPSLTGIALPGPSTGGSFAQFLPVTYFVSVRAVNAMGAGVGTGSTSITVPATTP